MEQNAPAVDLFDPIVESLRAYCDGEKGRIKALIDEDHLEEAERRLRALPALRDLLRRAESVATDYRAWHEGVFPPPASAHEAEAATPAELPEPAPQEQAPEQEASPENTVAETATESAAAAPEGETPSESAEAPTAEVSVVAPAASATASPAAETLDANALKAELERTLAPKRSESELTPKQLSQRNQLQREFTETCAKLRELDAKDSWSLEELARAKAHLCTLRALELELRPLRYDTQPIRDEIQYFGRLIGKHAGNGASNLATELATGKPSDWREYSRAFQCLAAGEWAAQWIREHPGNLDYRRVLNELASCGHIVYRIHQERRLPFDKQQEAFKKFIESIAGEAQIQCWMSPDSGGPKTDKVFKLAEGFQQKFQSDVVNRLKASQRELLLAELNDFVSAPYEGQDFIGVLAAKAQECLKAGTQPSNKKLRELLTPFASVLTGGDGQYKRLVEYVKLDALQDAQRDPQALRGKDPTADEITDEEHQRRMDALRGLLRGKRMLIVGGSKGQADRRIAIEKAFELAELDWPDVEKDDKLDLFWPKLEKADIAVQLIKFCRHHYAEVLRAAKEQGKMVARIKGGLGLKRFALDLYEQLIANHTANCSQAS
ncbi:MAG: hypothetical protein WHU10_01505 [Fimbriimonadales bacterium]